MSELSIDSIRNILNFLNIGKEICNYMFISKNWYEAIEKSNYIWYSSYVNYIKWIINDTKLDMNAYRGYYRGTRFENYKKFKPRIKPCKRRDILKNLSFAIAKDASMNLNLFKKLRNR